MYKSIAVQVNVSMTMTVYLGVEFCFINWVAAVNIDISILITRD